LNIQINYLCCPWNTITFRMMLCILLEENDPNFCLSAEEFLLKNYEEDIFMIWQSCDSVVIGKHQNALAEINYRYVMENGIKVARRISGGGTVFHDPGNVNFSFIKRFDSPQEVSFNYFTRPIVTALQVLGVNAESSGRHDLVVEGRKISGNAEHIYKNRVLHHGTLLFDSDLKNLGNAIRVIPGKYRGKAVESIRSVVANISEFLPIPLTKRDFIMHIVKILKSIFPDVVDFQIPENEKEKIRILSCQKFETQEWQFGYSPGYTFSNVLKSMNRDLSIELSVEKGIIRTARLSGSFYSVKEIKQLEALLTGKYHLYETIDSVYQLLGLQSDNDLIYSYF
jgi:lipoate---protein ligase